MPRSDVCPGRCNARYRKVICDYERALAEYHVRVHAWEALAANTQDELPERPEPPAEPDIRPTAGDPVWCSRCAGMIRRALAELDDLASLLESWSDGHRGATSGQVPGTRRAHSPSPSPIADTLDELYAALTKVEDDWREARGLPHRPRRGGPEARARCIAWLLGQLGMILAHPGSVQFGRATLAWQRRLQAAAHSDPVVRRRAGACPRCGRRGLRTRDDGYTQCARCGRLLNEDEYNEIAEQQADRPAAEPEEAQAS